MALTEEEKLRKKEMADQIEELQKQLIEKIFSLDKQRKEEAARFESELAQRNAMAEMERKQRLEKHQKAEEEHRAKKQRELDAIEEQKREVARKQKEAELAVNAAQEDRRQQEAKLKWLQEEIAKQEFVEEQHHKRLETAVQTVTTEAVEDSTISVEHPVAPDNKGNAVVGTEGSTPDSPLMSHHLKHILRQATRM
jgi:hypothetical protein